MLVSEDPKLHRKWHYLQKEPMHNINVTWQETFRCSSSHSTSIICRLLYGRYSSFL